MSATAGTAPIMAEPETAPNRDRWTLGDIRGAFREERLFLLLAIVIGVLSGLAVVCFRVAIEWSRLRLLGSAVPPSGVRLLLAPALVGLLVGVIVTLLFPRVRGSGVNQTKAALYIYNGYISFRTVIGKFICSALAIGAGHSLGPEDPSLQIGAGIASALGRGLKLSREKLRLIAPVGAAAGLAAAFNAPISAVLFVIEEVIGRWSAGVLGAVVLSAVASTVVQRWFLGFVPLFRIPAFQMFRAGELLAYAALGVVGGFASVVFAKAIAWLRPRLIRLPRWTFAIQPAVAGLLVGAIGFLGFPQVMGAGYEYVDQAIHDQFTWQLLGILAGLKILSTTISFVSGTPGGMFAPTLFIGAMLGGFVGGAERIIFPHLTGSPAAYALVGIGVLFAGFLRAPMTSVFMVLEVSGNYSIIVPVIIANTIAYLISRSLQPAPLFDMLSRQDGLDLPSMEEEREMTVVRIEDAMRPPPATVLSDDMTVDEAVKRVGHADSDVVLVRRSPSGWSTVRKDDLKKMIGEGKPEMTLMSVLAPKSAPVLHPDHPLDTALHYIYDWPMLPVVNRADLSRLEGVLTMADILRAYRGAEAEPANASQIPYVR
ncbi:MAG: chloride channel protein [Terriglobales bacterium]